MARRDRGADLTDPRHQRRARGDRGRWRAASGDPHRARAGLSTRRRCERAARGARGADSSRGRPGNEPVRGTRGASGGARGAAREAVRGPRRARAPVRTRGHREDAHAFGARGARRGGRCRGAGRELRRGPRRAAVLAVDLRIASALAHTLARGVNHTRVRMPVSRRSRLTGARSSRIQPDSPLGFATARRVRWDMVTQRPRCERRKA